jgi:type IV pilus assembly protein PilY1
VLWEFTSADMGYTIPQPTMGQLADDSWVALIPNGYDSTEQEGKLVVLDLEDGSPVNVLQTNASLSGKLNGLSTPVPVDLDGDRKTDLLYAGDLLGNLWRFDVRSSDSTDWSTRLIYTACVDATCSTSNRQPITARPMVIAHPNGGVMVLFATGSYFTNEDRSSIQLQALYGVWDKLEASPTLIAKSDLVQQSILAEVSTTSTRVISNNEVNYGSKRGWYLNLLTPGLSTGVGERVITDIQLREDQLVVTSMLPSTDPCDYGGKSWLLELAPLTGSRLSYPVFDINADGKIDSNDNQTVTIDGKSVTLPASGKGFDEILTKSAFVEKIDGTTEIKYASGSSGSIKQTLEIISPNAKGRQSWRQLR